MPALRIDFAAAERPHGMAGLAVLGIALACAATAAVIHYRVLQESAVIEARLDALGTPSRAASASASVDPARVFALRKRAETAGRIVDALEQPWIRLFDDIEAAGVRGISLLALEPDADKASIRLSGEAADRDTLSRYLERLGEAASLREVRLSQHEWQQRGGKSALRFVVTARWTRQR